MPATQFPQFSQRLKDGSTSIPAIPEVQKQTIVDYLKAIGYMRIVYA